MSVHRSIPDLEIYRRPVPISEAWGIFGGLYSLVRRMHTPNFGDYHLLSITSSVKLLSMSVHQSVHDLEFIA